MSRKSEATCKRVHDTIMSLRPLFNSSSFRIDFELGVMKVINSCWSRSSVSACFFRLTQNIYRQLQKAGFTTKYANDERIFTCDTNPSCLGFLENK